jgi:phage tail-like protein
MPDLSTASCFVLDMDGVELGTFRKVTGLAVEREVIEFKENTKEGKMIIRKVPGANKPGEVTLERRVDNSSDLWDLHKTVSDGDIDKGRRHLSIVVKNSMLEEVARWNFTNGWVSKWEGPDLDAGSNDVAVEKVTITHEGITK